MKKRKKKKFWQKAAIYKNYKATPSASFLTFLLFLLTINIFIFATFTFVTWHYSLIIESSILELSNNIYSFTGSLIELYQDIENLDKSVEKVFQTIEVSEEKTDSLNNRLDNYEVDQEQEKRVKKRSKMKIFLSGCFFLIVTGIVFLKVFE